MLLIDKKRQGKKLTTSEFIERAREVHGDKYDYSKAEYLGKYSRITIFCTIHGEFKQIASNHLHGHNCPECATISHKLKKSLTLAEVITRSNEVHNNKYTYDKVKYVNSKSKIVITCPDHGDFEQTLSCHLRGSGCSKCASKGVSKIANKWLDSLGIATEYREVAIKEYPTRPLDAYVAETNTVYQFHGDFWHGNPDRFKSDDVNSNNGHRMGDLYNNTIEWDKQIRDLGYNLIVIWELEFRQQLKSN